MEHELLHTGRSHDLRIATKIKKEKDKNDQGERKKWNFRRTSSSEGVGHDEPFSTFGLISQTSEVRSKKAVSPTMIFENALSDHDEQNDVMPRSPTTLSVLQSPTQQKQTPPKLTIAEPKQLGKTDARTRQKSLPSSTSPPPIINRPRSAQKSTGRFQRYASVPAGPQALPGIFQKSPGLGKGSSFSPSAPVLSERLDANKQWHSNEQSFFMSENSPNAMDELQEEPHKTQTLSDKDISTTETVDDHRYMMWQGNQKQEINAGNWAEFLSPNEVFVPDGQAWASAENAAIDEDENEHIPEENLSNSSRSLNSSDSDDELTEESVWKINEEQRAYYSNQFRILQPAEKGVVAGQKARDFFLKSGLGTVKLSKIWNLADLDGDGALNFQEFCIAMHVVVAVRHGLEVPDTLPQYLVPDNYETRGASPAVKIADGVKNEDHLQEPSQSWARFSPDPRNTNPTVLSETDGPTVQQAGQAVPTNLQHPPAMNQPRGQTAVQTQAVGLYTQVLHHPQTTSTRVQHTQQVSKHSVTPVQHSQAAAQPPQQMLQQQTQSAVVDNKPQVSPGRRLERTPSDPGSTDENAPKESNAPTPRKTSLGIPRVRGQPKQTNLLDTPHWAILPPPSKFSKDNPDEANKGQSFVPTGTIISADTEENGKPVLSKPDKPGLFSPGGDLESDSSSSETEQAINKKENRKSTTDANRDSDSSVGAMKDNGDVSVGEDKESVDGEKKFIAPVPPPRRKSGHSRSSSLDLQKFFSKTGGAAPALNVPDHPNEPPPPPRETQENFADFSKFDSIVASHSNDNIARFGHRRSASLDSTHAVWVESNPQPPLLEDVEGKDYSTARNDVPASLPRPVPKMKPASPPRSMRQKKDVQHDSGSDSMIEKEKKLSKEPIHFVVKPLTRLEQLHAKIRDFKSRNTRLSRMNNELQQELKQMMEKRIGLESSLEQLKPFAK